jgi:hypothetical protein
MPQLVVVEELVTCTTCEIPKPRSRFNKSKTKLNGLQSRCKDCKNKFHGSRSPHTTKYYDGYHVPYNFEYKYGITFDQYMQMLEDQNGVCRLCKGTNPSGRRLAVDHNHETGEVRGLLCSNCNTALGLLKDNPVLLEAAIAYLRGRI